MEVADLGHNPAAVSVSIPRR